MTPELRQSFSGKPGSALTFIIKRFFSELPRSWSDLVARVLVVRIPSDCGCKDLAEKMDVGGVSWCRSNRWTILSRLVRNGIYGCRWHLGWLLVPAIAWKSNQWVSMAIAMANQDNAND